MNLPVGALLDGRYRIERFLGAGAMGVVYEVVDAQGRKFAAKTLLRISALGQTPDAIARFMLEGGGSSVLNSPHVVASLDAGVEAKLGVPFFVMPLLNGYDCEQLIERVGPIHPVIASRIAMHACRGLFEAHAKGVVHRDIKPSNLFLHHEPDGQVTVKLCDFGIAKWGFGAQDITRSGSILGTPLYMSPEHVASSKRVDGRADIWSLAMSVYHALVGAPAFERVGSIVELLLAVVNGKVPHIQDAAPWIAPELASVLHGALIADPLQRCPDVETFGKALLPLLGGSEDIHASMLGPLPPDLRAFVAPRVQKPRAWSEVKHTASGVSPQYAQAKDPLLGTTLGGKYRIERLIGKGGMGAIYHAAAPDGTGVAVKVLLSSADAQRPEMLRRFVREAKALTSIKSPYVVRVLDVDTDEPRQVPFIVMELLNGVDLDNLVKKWGALDPGPALRLFIQVARGLSVAHGLGIVHRDIKPANIFLHELPTGEVVPKLCDFGIAKRIAVGESEENTVELTRTGGVIGSPIYMSPEQAKSAKHVDARTDIWSLGMALWETLSGRRPWDDCSSVGEIIVAICTRPVTPLQDVAPWIEPDVAAAVHRCLHQAPSERYSSVDEMIAALEAGAVQHTRLDRSTFTPVSPALRERVAQRATVDARSVKDQSLIGHASTVADGGPKRSSSRLWIGGGLVAAIAATAGAAGVMLRPSQKADMQPVSAASENVAPSATPQPETRNVRVTVTPPEAVVTVDGAPKELSNGTLEIEGKAGQSFLVVASVGTAKVEQSLVITIDGRAQPERIEVPPEVAADAGPVAASGGGRRGGKRDGAKNEPATGETKTAGPSATTTATGGTAPPPPKVKAADDW